METTIRRTTHGASKPDEVGDKPAERRIPVVGATLGRNFIGIERDAAHYKTACDRIAHELDGALL